MYATAMMKRPCKTRDSTRPALQTAERTKRADGRGASSLQGRFIIAVAYIHRAYVYAYVYVSGCEGKECEGPSIAESCRKRR